MEIFLTFIDGYSEPRELEDAILAVHISAFQNVEHIGSSNIVIYSIPNHDKH